MSPESEVKYLLTAARTDALTEVLDAHLSHARYGGPGATTYVRTLYLDTEDMTYLRSSETPVRRRLRIREYANQIGDSPPTLTGGCYLELKEARGVVRSKTRVALPSRVLRRLVTGTIDHAEWELALSRMVSLKPLLAAMYSGSVRPRVTTWCRRDSYLGDGLRVTVDREVGFLRPLLPGASHVPDQSVARGPERILEIKTTGEIPDWLQNELSSTDHTPFSKFRAGMAALGAKSAPRAARLGTAA